MYGRAGSVALGELNNEWIDGVNDKTRLPVTYAVQEGKAEQHRAMERLRRRAEIVFVTKREC